tara:strand:+ start:1261 stop:1545 length:285 start_codon:yes stop_codon:yes gene_type:complete
MKKIILLVLVLMTLTACGGGEEVQFANYSDQTPNPSELELLKIRVDALEKELAALEAAAIGQDTDIIAYMNNFKRDFDFYKSNHSQSCHREGYC